MDAQPTVTTPSAPAGFWTRWIDEGAGYWMLAGLVACVAVCGSVLCFEVPQPAVHDEFAYLLQADTFAHGRLTNPPPAHPEFFESFHILVTPSYTAKYPPGQGLFLALGQRLGHPIIGVWLSVVAMCAAVAWSARPLVGPRWAFVAGAFCAFQFGFWHYWARSYWGGAVAAFGGALVLGATLRLLRDTGWRQALLCGAGGAVLMLTRPFEGMLFCVVPAILLAVRGYRLGLARAVTWSQLLVPAVLMLGLGVAFVLYYNQRVTGSPWELPYLVYEKQYSGAPVFVWEHQTALPHFSNAEQKSYFEKFVVPNSRFHQPFWRVYFDRLSDMMRRDFGWLGLVAIASLFVGGISGEAAIALAMALTTSIALVLCYWYSPHYQAPALAVWIILVIIGLRGLWRCGKPRVLRRSFALLALTIINAWPLYKAQESNDRGLHFFGLKRAQLAAHLLADGKRHLVFVGGYTGRSPHLEWVYNGADLAGEPILWAHELGRVKDRELEREFPDRKVLHLFLKEDDGESKP